MNQNRGVVLYVVVILLLLLTIIAIAAMNTGVLEERIARNRYGNNESLFAAESGASKVVSCFSGGENDLCKNVLSPGGKERLSFLDNKPHDFFNANGKSVRFIAYNPKPAIVLPNPAQFVLPATAVGLPVAAWPRELDTSQTSETFCPPQASCVTASVYPKIASNEANAGIGSDLGYAIIAGGKVTIEEGTAQNGGNSGGGAAGGGSGTGGAGDGTGSGGTDQNSAPASTSPAPQTLDLQQHLWLAALSTPSHRFDFPWLAQTGTGTNTGGTGGATGSGSANSGGTGGDAAGGGTGTGGNANGGGTGGGGNNQNQQRVIAASIHGQDGIDLADVNVTGFATSGGTVTPASQVVVQIWDQGNCKDCFLDVESDFQNFTDRINSYMETIKETYPDNFEEIQQGAFGSAQSSGNQDSSGSTGGGSQGGGNQDNSNQGGSTGGATGSGGANSGGTGGAAGGGASLNLVPVPQSPVLQQHLWLAALSTPSHRFDFPWLAQNTETGTATSGTGGATGSGGANGGGTGGASGGGTGTGGNANGGGTGGGGNNQNQQAVEPQDLQGKIYYYDGDVTIYGNAAPVNGTIVATGDIIVEPFTTGSSSGSRLCPGDEPLVGQTVATVQAMLQFGQVAIPWATNAASLVATVSASAAGTAATAGTGAVAAVPLSATQILQFARQTLQLVQTGAAAATELCGLARSAIGTARSAVDTARGLLPGNGANNASNSSEQSDSQTSSNNTFANSPGQSGSQNSNNSASDSSGQSGSQNSSNNAFDSSGQSNSPESFAPLNLIAGGNIELHRDLLGTMIAQGDITIGPEVMQIAYPPLPEEAPRMASWQRNYLLGTD